MRAEVQAVFGEYIRIGGALRDAGTNLQHFIDSLLERSSIPRPFGVVDGPSGIGKTQQFFALSDVKVVFIPVTKWQATEATQHIYRIFKGVTQAFCSALAADVAEIRFDPYLDKDDHGNSIFSTGSFENLLDHEMCTAAVVLGILTGLVQLDWQDVIPTLAGVKRTPGASASLPYDKKTTLRTLRTFVQSLDASQKFVFVLDEVPGSDGHPPTGDNLKKLTFARNIFRACGLTVILAGTGSTVLNHLAAPSSVTCPVLYCKGVTQVPPPSEETLAAALQTDGLKLAVKSTGVSGLWELIVSSRPRLSLWLARFALEQVEPTLDSLVDAVASKLFETKSVLRHGRGQLISFEQLSQVGEGLHDTPARELVVKHMANLYFNDGGKPARQADFFATDTGVKMSVVVEGKACFDVVRYRCAFPRVEEEPLLYMVVHGTMSTHPFGDKHKVSTATERYIKGRSEFADARFMDGHGSAIKRDGNRLEAIVSVAWCVATRKFGFGGSNVDAIMNSIMTELSLGSSWVGLKTKVQDEWSKYLPASVRARIHPYLFHPRRGSEKWALPQDLCSPDRRIALVWRARDIERHDLHFILPPPEMQDSRNVLQLTWECKNRERQLQTALLIECITRIPVYSHIHLVVCEDVGGRLFQDAQGKCTSFEVGGEEKRCRVLLVRRLQDTLVIDYISNNHKSAWCASTSPPAREPDHVVVVVPLLLLAEMGSAENVTKMLAAV